MSLPPNDWAEETIENSLSEETHPVEWENPEWSSLPALLVTLRRVLWQPKRFFTNLPLTGGLGEPLGFALLVGTLGVLSSLIWQLVLEGGFSETMPAVALSKHLGNFMQDPKVVVGIFLLTPFLVAFGQFFLSLCLLGAVRLTGPENTPFESVFRLAAYAQASAVAGIIPWGGAFLVAVWNLILLVIGLSKKFGFSIMKAVFTLVLATAFQGLLFFFGLLLGGVLGLWGFFFS
jgi:hypothetical protein